ncbi:2-Ketovalerate ferredoxin oxidoreductase subunit [Elusimicrobium minutum Pei191]|uniref:2-Ketovalerate ferredoxin oxidoreductase subunit n=1 Tax=Elusimicrobium minutum (strain Pei191) TaxID=445932 RepID=B2KET0_ELUMP|nr:2-oxoacid:acceptor oxidoreductase family protein [Elusimicrobium minutum]ACC99026.1 2-Ketovalerate ferredoxin oxidoreductase subunit [Elusimicrobium minutum Pei191]
MYQGIRISGFGGQGVVSAGILLAQAGLIDGKKVSWLPSYGPEMRGGTANCSVVIASDEVYTPIVTAPDTVIVMNEPSLPKFEPLLKKDGLLIINSSLINSKPKRTDIKVIYVPCNEIAEKLGSLKVATLVAMGAFAKATGAVSIDTIASAMKAVFKRAKPEMLELNKKALEEGAKAAD